MLRCTVALIVLAALCFADTPDARAQIERMRALRSSIDHASNASSRAAKWMELNTMAERLAEMLGMEESRKPLADEATALGVSVSWCEPSGSWAAGNQGYEKYLQLAPDGPQADTAWWQGRVMSSCGDSEGTAEEYQYAIDTYTAFLKHFPKSRFAPEAREQLKGNREGLKKQLAADREYSRRHPSPAP